MLIIAITTTIPLTPSVTKIINQYVQSTSPSMAFSINPAVCSSPVTCVVLITNTILSNYQDDHLGQCYFHISSGDESLAYEDLTCILMPQVEAYATSANISFTVVSPVESISVTEGLSTTIAVMMALRDESTMRFTICCAPDGDAFIMAMVSLRERRDRP